MSESELQNAILLEYGRDPDVTLWRQNVGSSRTEVATRAHLERLLGWLSDPRPAYVDNARMLVASLLAEKPRFTSFGLCKGSSDIIGIVTSEFRSMVGNAPRGIFLALEVKKIGGKLSKEQKLFLDLVNRRGGVGRMVQSVEDAGRAIEEAKRR